ncbi:NUDIX domain-containing protein [Erythrobacter sp. LQ02-29]|uniref:NUDIX domain-containing protein n=1 Tax=Erythrobacter sp. LQ02-29 TaxID=2920384 RepID=UPI001F4DFCE1|nr:NUDIX domain-containing protein [Erythrobacter sp. LQ02-29]
MLRLIENLAGRVLPAPLHRLGLRVAYRIRRIYRRVAKPDLNGVAVIVLNDAGHVLLVRHTYGSGDWAVPGGGIDKGEPPADAARREMREELKVDLVDLREIACTQEHLAGTTHTAHIFAARVDGAVSPDRREIAEHAFFPLAGLPEPMLPLSKARLRLYRERTAPD